MDTEQATPLTTADYQALHAMQMSDDPGQRDQAASLAKKLTPSEQQAFFDVQKVANAGKGERTRTDNSLLGMPPELAVASGIPIARAAAGAGASLSAKVAAAAGAAAPQVAAQAKYWATKLALIKLGVNATLAEGVAIAASGIKKGAPKGEPPTGPTVQGVSVDELRAAGVGEPSINVALNGRSGPSPAPPASPVASSPVVPAPQAGPVSPPSAPPPPAASVPSPPAPVPAGPPAAVNTLPDQKSLNEAALAIRRQAYQERMAAQSSAQMSEMTAEGAARASSAQPYVKPAPLTKDETIAFTQLLRRMPGAEAMKTILAQRELAARFGTLSNADVATEIADRLGNRSPKR